MTIRAQIITGIVAVTTAVGISIAWHHYRPYPRLAKVDILGIVTAKQKELSEKVKPGMDEIMQKKLIDEASGFGAQLGVALNRVADECQCTIINSAAIVQESPSRTILDLTQRVSELANARK